MSGKGQEYLPRHVGADEQSVNYPHFDMSKEKIDVYKPAASRRGASALTLDVQFWRTLAWHWLNPRSMERSRREAFEISTSYRNSSKAH